MHLKVVAACSTAALVMGGAAAAGAVPGQTGSTQRTKHPRTVRAHVVKLAQATHVTPRAVFDAAVAYLQIDAQTLFADLKNGQSLAQIAIAQGKTPDGLVNAAVAAAQAQLDAAVAGGTLSAAKEQVLLTKMRTVLAVLVTKSIGARTTPGTVAHRTPVSLFYQPVLDYLHLDLATVIDEVRSGKTLAQIAVAHGKTADGLAAAIVATGRARLDAAVAAGKLTPASETALLAKLQASATAIVNGGNR